MRSAGCAGLLGSADNVIREFEVETYVMAWHLSHFEMQGAGWWLISEHCEMPLGRQSVSHSLNTPLAADRQESKWAAWAKKHFAATPGDFQVLLQPAVSLRDRD
jgi:hypothetical protein